VGTQLNTDWSCNPQEFLNLSRAFTALLTLPSTTTTAESSLSALRILKTYLRSTMKDDHLSELALVLQCRDIVNDFAASGNRRILAIRIDCNKYRWWKALFYCGTEINILKFRYILHIQLNTHTINSLEGLICLVYYRVTLKTGLQQFKKLATLLTSNNRHSPSFSLRVFFFGEVTKMISHQICLL